MGGETHALGHQAVSFVPHLLNIKKSPSSYKFRVPGRYFATASAVQPGRAPGIYRLHAQIPGFGDSEVLHFLPIEVDFAGSGLVIAGDDLDQGRFPGPVIPKQPDNFIPSQLKIDIFQRLDLAKRLGYISQFEAVIFHKIISIAVYV